jgi:hypothetical protein
VAREQIVTGEMTNGDVPLVPPPPPAVRSVTWDGEPDQEIDAATSVRDGTLWLQGTGPSSVAGHTAHPNPVRDIVLDCVVTPHGLGDDEGFGLYVRQNQPGRYVALRVTPARLMTISAFDGTEQPLASGALAPGMVLHAGANRVTVLCAGPSITLSLNGLVATSVLVDPRFVDGFCGFMLEQRHETTPRLQVHWAQLRDLW